MITMEELKNMFNDCNYIINDKLLLWTYYNIQKLNDDSNITALGLFGDSGTGKTKYVQVYKEILSKALKTDVQLVTFCCGIDSLNTIVGDDEDKNKSSIDKVYLSEAITMANEGKKVILFIDNYNEDNKITDNFLSGFIEYGLVRISENKVVRLQNKNNLQIIIARNNDNLISNSLMQKMDSIKLEPLKSMQILEYVDSLDIKCNGIIKYLVLYINDILINNYNNYGLLRLPSIPQLIKVMENIQFLVDSNTKSTLIFDIVYNSLINTKKSKSDLLETPRIRNINSIFRIVISNGKFDEYKLINKLLEEISSAYSASFLSPLTNANYLYNPTDINSFFNPLTNKIKQLPAYIKMKEEEKLEEERQKLLKAEADKNYWEQIRERDLERIRLQREEDEKEEEAKKIDLVSRSKYIESSNDPDKFPFVKNKLSDRSSTWQYNELVDTSHSNKWYQVAYITGVDFAKLNRNNKINHLLRKSNIIFEYFNRNTKLYHNRLILNGKNEETPYLRILNSEPIISYLALSKILQMLKQIDFNYCRLTMPVLSSLKEAQKIKSANVKYDPNYSNVVYFEDEFGKNSLGFTSGLLKVIFNEVEIISHQNNFIIPINVKNFLKTVKTIQKPDIDTSQIVSLKLGLMQLKIECYEWYQNQNLPLCETIKNNFNSISNVYNEKVGKDVLPNRYEDRGNDTVFKLLSSPQLLKKESIGKGIYIVNKGTEEEFIIFNPQEALLDNEKYEQKLLETNGQLIKKLK